MENIKCIFCNTESNLIWIKENGYLGRKCLTCNLIYISPRPSLKEIVNLYSHDEANIPAARHIKESFINILNAKHNLKIIRKYINNGRILEIGAGGGYFLNEARKIGFEVYGIEFNEIQADFINNKLKIPCEQLPLSDETFGTTKFDIIYHCDVISHLFNPINDFKRIRNKLNDDGFVIFETGNLGDVDIKYLKYYTLFQYPDHLFFFSEYNIKLLLEKTGFELVKIYNFSILMQLFITKILLRLNDFIRSKRKPNYQKKSDIKHLVNYERGNNEPFLKNSYFYFIYLIRYKLGSIFPKKGRPQTMIIVGKKNNIEIH